jgi:hypothetical protein
MKPKCSIPARLAILLLLTAIIPISEGASLGLRYMTSIPVGSLRTPVEIFVATNWPGGEVRNSWQLYQMVVDHFERVGEIPDVAGGVLFSSQAKPNGRYIYAMGPDGIVVNDFADPVHPVKRGGYRIRDAWALDVAGPLIYVAAYESGLQIIDASNPDSTSLVGRYPRSLAESLVACDVVIRGDFALIAERDQGLQVFRITNLDNITLAGKLVINSGAHSIALAGDTAYVLGFDNRIYIIDITSPTTPVLISTYSPDNLSVDGIAAIRVVGGLAYIATYTNGIQVLDVTNPSKVLKVASFDTYGRSSGLAVANGRIFVADQEGGLVILQLVNNPVAIPTIVAPPANTTVPLGATAQFDVTATGPGVVSYQWLLEGYPITGATNRGLALTKVGVANRARYAVVVSTDGGSVITPSAMLGVVLPPVISVNPRDVWGVEGETVSISALAGPEPPLDLQWLFEGQVLPGKTNAILTLPEVSLTQAGRYSLMVSNIAGVATSQYALLSVLPRLDVREMATWKMPVGENVRAEAVHVVNGYAYVAGGFAGGQILDIRNATNIVLAGVIPASGYVADIIVVGNIAYIGASAQGGLQIFDVNNPAKPVRLGSIVNGSPFYTVRIAGHYAFTVEGIAGFEIYDIINPAKPKRMGGYARNEAVEVYTSLEISDDSAYLADSNHGLTVLNISDLTNPVFSDHYAPGTFLASFSGQKVHLSGRTAFLAAAYDGLYVFDVSQPGKVVYSTSIDTPGFAFAIKTALNYAYVADYDGGLQIVDLSIPAHPALVGTFKTTGDVIGVDVDDRYIYVSDTVQGIHILQASRRTPPTSIPRLEVGWSKPDRNLHVKVTDSEGSPVVLQYSTDLVEWTPILTNSVGPLEHSEAIGPGESARFFRAVK